jgi:hypothetical protein
MARIQQKTITVTFSRMVRDDEVTELEIGDHMASYLQEHAHNAIDNPSIIVEASYDDIPESIDSWDLLPDLSDDFFTDEAPVTEAHVEEDHVEEVHVEEAPVEAHVEEVHVEEVHVEEVHVEEVHVEEAPVEEVPADWPDGSGF